MKCEASVKLTGREERDFIEILFNPNAENPVVSVLGEKSLKFFELKENIEEKTFEVEEWDDKPAWELTQKHVLKAHHYLSNSQHIAVLAEEAVLVVDYKGAIVQRIE